MDKDEACSPKKKRLWNERSAKGCSIILKQKAVECLFCEENVYGADFGCICYVVLTIIIVDVLVEKEDVQRRNL